MAQITRYPMLAHLRSEPNQFILHYSSGRITREGPGTSYWFRPLSAAVAQVPVDDCSATFLLAERSADFQEVSVQCTVVYRFNDPRLAASRINFSLSLINGNWIEDPLERVARLWNQRARPAVRAYLAKVPVAEAIRTGPALLGHSLGQALADDPELAAMGLRLISVQVDQVTATPEVRKALETPTREAIQQKADEAVFERRALAVEKERAIKQNELSTEIDLARRQDELIRQQGRNTLREVESNTAAERAKLDADLARQKLITENGVNELKLKTEAEASAKKAMADAEATSTQLVGNANAQSRRAMLDAETEAEIRSLEAWKNISPDVVAALGFKALSEKITKIGDVHLTPDLVGDWIGKLLKGKVEVGQLTSMSRPSSKEGESV
jgi:regulator of protease activity HflC (stomatin/prohibitin superfamily)